MIIKKVWLECEDRDGKHYMTPATPADIRELLDESSADIETRKDLETAGQLLEAGMSKNVVVKAEGQGLELQTWEPGPGYTLEEIEAMRLKPGELREAGKR